MKSLIYGETGVYPVNVLVKMRLIRFWSSLISNKAEKYSSKLYDILFNLYKKGIYFSKWVQAIKDILIETGFDCVWESQSFISRDTLCKNVNQVLKDNFQQEWREALEQSNKCLFYRNFKQTFCKEKYISQLPDAYVISFLKFRCCNHNLEIELGRRTGTPRELRTCKKCTMSVIGDEFHFVMECPKYDELRKKYLPQKYLSPKSVFNFCRLFCGSKTTQLKIGKFIKFANVV